MKTIWLLVLSIPVVVGLTGCNAPHYKTDDKLREELFFKCMQSLPAGPLATKYNDWDEVVSECGQQAYYLSNRCVSNCS